MALFDSLCAASSLQLNPDVAATLTLDHLLYDHLSTQPYIKLLISLTHLDYPKLG